MVTSLSNGTIFVRRKIYTSRKKSTTWTEKQKYPTSALWVTNYKLENSVARRYVCPSNRISLSRRCPKARLGNTDSTFESKEELPGGRNSLEHKPGHLPDPGPGESGPQTPQERGRSPYITLGRGGTAPSMASTWTRGPSEWNPNRHQRHRTKLWSDK